LAAPEALAVARPLVGAGAAARDRLTWACAAVGLIALWFLCRPYPGIFHDSRVYVGRALANLDPTGLGRQVDFVRDGQTGFSIFPPLLTAAVRAFGPGAAAMATVALGLTAWLAAATLLAARLLKGRQVLAALACLAVFPLGYGGDGVLHLSEAYVTPRNIAEAAGLAALALLLDGRKAAAIGLWLVAAAFHPIMALPIGGIGLILLGLEDRRWFYLAGAGAVAVIAAAARLPLAGRLFETFDPAWMSVLVSRNPYLFPSLWPEWSWALLVCQTTTLVLAWTFISSTYRRLSVAAGAVALAGLLLAFTIPSVLIVQAQPWRALWPVTVLTALAFVPCASGLWREGGCRRAALAMLIVAWAASDDSLWAALFGCGGALALRFLPPPPAVRRLAPPLAWALAAVFTVALMATQIWVVLHKVEGMPKVWALSTPILLSTGLLTMAVIMTAVLVDLGTVRVEGWRGRSAAGAGALALAALAAWTWDARSPAARAAENPNPSGRLRAATAGSIYWLDGPGNIWLWARRPEWWSQAQGAGIVFDRSLALAWDQRFRALAADGLAQAEPEWATSKSADQQPLKPYSGASLRKLCAAADHPDWLIGPTWRMRADALPLARTIWRAPATDYLRGVGYTRAMAVRDYAVFACADLAKPQPDPRPSPASAAAGP
jgi:hypothetical protein